MVFSFADRCTNEVLEPSFANPGSSVLFIPGSGFGINIPDHIGIRELSNILCFLFRDEKIRIRDPV
jgi:hypothetical protein